MFSDTVLRKEVVSTPAPTLKIDRREVKLNTSDGIHFDVAHNIADFTVARVIDCHTIAHAPYPASASHTPTMPDATSPMVLLTATIFTVIIFVRRLVCTTAVALIMKVRNMTRDRGISFSEPKTSAISGAAIHSTA